MSRTYDDDYDETPRGGAAEPSQAAPARDRKPVWIRGAFMLFFVVAMYLVQGLIALIALIQFLSLMIAGAPNAFLGDFGRSLGRWLEQVSRFQSAADDDKPFPWAPWPKAG